MKLRRQYGGSQFGSLRAGIAIFCALFFIASTFAHVALHASQPLSTVVGEMSAPGDDHGSAPIDGAIDATHCHGCAAVSTPELVVLAELSARSSVTKLGRTEIAVLSPRVFDPPPPKS
jgi:hypothetical protein